MQWCAGYYKFYDALISFLISKLALLGQELAPIYKGVN